MYIPMPHTIARVISRLALVMIFPFFLYTPAEAQILPPDFTCVNNDTLIWQPVANTCGPFQSYSVFAAQNPAGPYQLLATIPDMNQNRYFHDGVSGQTWYYYLQSNYDCPGQTPLSSDTLDNRIPLEGPLGSASVMGDDVVLSWSPSPSPEVRGYIVSRNTATGTTILDTVYNATTYTDTGADPQNGTETYFVTAIDGCGNRSLVGVPHTTILLTSMPPDSCVARVNLNWSAYQNTTGGGSDVERYEIFASVNGSSFERIDTVGGSETFYGFDQGNDGETICYYVEAVLRDSFRARSSTTCQDIRILQPIRRVELLTADVQADGSVVLEWQWDGSAMLTEAWVERQAGGSSTRFAVDLQPGLNNVTFTDSLVDASAGLLTYVIEARDACGSSVFSNEVSPIYLTGQAPGSGVNELAWTAFGNPLARVSFYRLVKKASAGDVTLVTGPEQAFTDVIDPTGPDAAGLCYYVVAELNITLADGEELTRTVRSNEVCLDQPAQVFLPNVFSPDASEQVNREFRPYLAQGTPSAYELMIFDRWGGQVFRSEDIDRGWDGRRNGRDMPTGVYFYFLRLTQSNGKAVEKEGTVTLIR